MRSRFSYLTIAFWAIASIAVLAFLGCEWGGAHENTWNDGYSWANFTGTYRFVRAVYYLPLASSGSEPDSKQLKSVKDFAKETEYPIYNGQANGRMDAQTKASGTFSVVMGLVPGSVEMTVSCTKKSGTAKITSDSSNNLIYKGKAVGNVTDKGTWSFSLPLAAGAQAGDWIGITYQYKGNPSGGGSSSSGGGSSSSSSGGGSSSSSSSGGGSSSSSSSGGGSSSSSSSGGGSSSSSSGGGAPNNAVYLSFLKVTQQGNKLTMIGDSGMVYKGQLTGASTSKDGYVAAQQVRLSFEATSATGNMKIIGHFSGVWSGSAEKQYGVLSERTIQGTHNRAGNFVGTAADTTIKVPDITISEVGVNSVGE